MGIFTFFVFFFTRCVIFFAVVKVIYFIFGTWLCYCSCIFSAIVYVGQSRHGWCNAFSAYDFVLCTYHFQCMVLKFSWIIFGTPLKKKYFWLYRSESIEFVSSMCWGDADASLKKMLLTIFFHKYDLYYRSYKEPSGVD